MARASILIARFPYQNSESPDVGDWLARTIPKMKAHPHVGEIRHFRADDTPITMTRNLAVEAAKQERCDYLLMCDADMRPDLPGDGALPFFDSSFGWLLDHRDEPGMVAAPYVGPPPFENIYVFRWANKSNNPLVADFTLDQYTRAEASFRSGFEEVGALATGLILIDMRVFALLEPEYFYYEWTDKTKSKKASTEDVTFTRDASLAGAKIYVNWNAWAGHHKRYMCGKPLAMTADKVRAQLAKAVVSKMYTGDRIVEVGVGEPGVSPPRPRATRDQLIALKDRIIPAEAGAPVDLGEPAEDVPVPAGVALRGNGLHASHGGGKDHEPPHSIQGGSFVGHT